MDTCSTCQHHPTPLLPTARTVRPMARTAATTQATATQVSATTAVAVAVALACQLMTQPMSHHHSRHGTAMCRPMNQHAQHPQLTARHPRPPTDANRHIGPRNRPQFSNSTNNSTGRRRPSRTPPVAPPTPPAAGGNSSRSSFIPSCSSVTQQRSC